MRGRGERRGRLRMPGRRPLLPDEPGDGGEVPVPEGRRVPGLPLQREVGDGAERTRGVVVEGEPVDAVVAVVDVLAAEDDHGAAFPPQHLAHAHPLVVRLAGRLAEHDHPESGSGSREWAFGQGLEQQEQCLAFVLRQGGCGGAVDQGPQRGEEGGPHHADGGNGVLVAVPPVAESGAPDTVGQSPAVGGLAGEYVVHRPDLPERGPLVVAAPRRPQVGQTVGGGAQGAVVTVLGPVVREHALDPLRLPRGLRGGRRREPGDGLDDLEGGAH